MSTVIPLDPGSPEGIATAQRLTEVLGGIQLAIWRRQQPATTAAAEPPRPQRRKAA